MSSNGWIGHQYSRMMNGAEDPNDKTLELHTFSRQSAPSQLAAVYTGKVQDGISKCDDRTTAVAPNQRLRENASFLEKQVSDSFVELDQKVPTFSASKKVKFASHFSATLSPYTESPLPAPTPPGSGSERHLTRPEMPHPPPPPEHAYVSLL